MMRKVFSLVIIVSFLLTQTTYANSDKKHDKKKDDHCFEAHGLHKALEKVKNLKARAAIKKNIEKKKNKCEIIEMTDEKKVAVDKAALSITFGGLDKADSVTVPIVKLPNAGINGTEITWSSSNSAIISHDGKTVNRPVSNDVNVTLTAKIKLNDVTETKKFVLTVKKQINDANKVAADKAALQITYASGDTVSHVTKPLQALPLIGLNGSNITWHSSNPAIISTNGQTVNRPAAGSGDAVVVISAILTKGSSSDTKIFILTVKQQLTNIQKVAADKAALQIKFGGSDTVTSVTRPVTLPVTGENGSTITWTSNNIAVLSHNGQTINRPALGAGDVSVTFTATIVNQGVIDIKVFNLTIKQEYTDINKVAADKADLNITFTGEDTINHVTAPMILPISGINGTGIGWYSNAPSIVSHNGSVVNRPAKGSGDATITLTAIISINGSYDIKNFVLTVKQLP
jgi:hypothetical protein